MPKLALRPLNGNSKNEESARPSSPIHEAFCALNRPTASLRLLEAKISFGSLRQEGRLTLVIFTATLRILWAMQRGVAVGDDECELFLKLKFPFLKSTNIL